MDATGKVSLQGQLEFGFTELDVVNWKEKSFRLMYMDRYIWTWIIRKTVLIVRLQLHLALSYDFFWNYNNLCSLFSLLSLWPKFYEASRIDWSRIELEQKAVLRTPWPWII